jgi:hypothetical protein
LEELHEIAFDADVQRKPQQSPQRKEGMPMANASNTTAPTQFIQAKLEKYAYRRFGKGQGLPLLCLQHFTGTLDNWDPAVTDPLA